MNVLGIVPRIRTGLHRSECFQIHLWESQMSMSAWLPCPTLLAWPRSGALQLPLTSQLLKMLHSLLPSARTLPLPLFK